jgi:hypothetical protein
MRILRTEAHVFSWLDAPQKVSKLRGLFFSQCEGSKCLSILCM